MTISIIAGPIIGAVIGYCTNYIAVKMLFRPLRPVKIGNFQVPFTPGIIPRGKDRLAKAVGAAVGNNLLTGETLKENLLSNEMVQKIETETQKALSTMESDGRTIQNVLTDYVGEESYARHLQEVESSLSDKLMDKVEEMDLGNIISENVAAAILDKVRGTLLEMMVTQDLVKTLTSSVSEKINIYILQNGPAVIEEKVKEECEAFMEKTVGETAQYIDDSDFDVKKIAGKLYKSLIESKLSSVIEAVNINNIIEKKIKDMDVVELEELVMSVMKKELNSIVNLGALIGFILGCINIIFI